MSTTAVELTRDMTVDIGALPAGREMDALVAEKVMGWYICQDDPDNDYYEDENTIVGKVKDWHPSTSISAAWELVEKLEEYCFHLITDRYGGAYSGGKWIAYFGLNIEGLVDGAWNGDTECSDFWAHSIPGVGAGETVPLAICRAALKAAMK